MAIPLIHVLMNLGLYGLIDILASSFEKGESILQGLLKTNISISVQVRF